MNNPANAIIHEFLLESFENLSNINEELTRYEKNSNDNELLNAIYRKVHTLKGSASFLGFKKLESITHIVENTLDQVRDNVFKITATMMDVILEAFDACYDLLKSVEEKGEEPNTDISTLLEKLKFASENEDEVVAKESKPMLGDMVFPNKKETVPQMKGPVKAVKIEEKNVNPTMVLSSPEPVHDEGLNSKNPNDEQNQKSQSHINDSTVRVNVKLLDKIMNVVGELVINRNQILQFSKKNEDAELNRFAQELNVITTELQTDIMTTRMQPVGLVFTKFERIVRDLSRAQSKKIKMDIQGQDTELDKTLIEVIKDPMTHLVRNSIDHGIESPEERKKRGKNETGILAIKAYHEGGQVIIEIADDGNGINTKKVLEKAIAKGLVTEEESLKLSHQKIVNFIFHPGFSTAEKVTNISGRGVGMDVVKSNIEKIGGEVEVFSKEGFGSTFKLKIPLTLAIVPALVIMSGNETFAIHQKNLVELVMFEDSDLEKIEKIHGNEFFRLRGELIPLFRLNNVLKMPKTDTTNHVTNIVVLRAEGFDYGLIVDHVLDTQEIVVKPLSRKLKNQSLYAGATIMGDGRVALIIDCYGFYNVVEHAHSTQEVVKEHKLDNGDNVNSDLQEYLLCSLGDKARYAIPLCLINRLEEFKPSSIEWSGHQGIVRYREEAMPLLNIEKLLALDNKSALDNLKDFDSIPCIVVQFQNQLFGLIVNEILDIGLTDEEIDSNAVEREGLLGVVYINERLTTVLDIHKLLEIGKFTKKIKGISPIKISGKNKVLIVEDSPLYRKIQQDFLTEMGVEVTLAKNGQEGIDYLKDGHSVDLVITDIEMPVMDGWQMAKEIRASNRPFSQVPIVAVSTKASDKDKARGIECGFSHHLEKLNKDEVLQVVNKYLK